MLVVTWMDYEWTMIAMWMDYHIIIGTHKNKKRGEEAQGPPTPEASLLPLRPVPPHPTPKKKK